MSDIPESPPSARSVTSGDAPIKPIPWTAFLLAALAVCSLAGVALGWQSLTRLHSLEQELVRRQDSSNVEAVEARALATQAQDLSRDTAAKLALLDARVAEVALQRAQLEDLMAQMSRSRDENLLGDIEAGINVAMQQSAITGSAEPLVAALQQAGDRLQRSKQPRLEGVRRAVVRDLDRIRAVNTVDVATLAIKLDEVARLLDELPLVSAAEKADKTDRADSVSTLPAAPLARATGAPRKAAAASEAEPLPKGWRADVEEFAARLGVLGEAVWGQAKGLLRVTRIDHPEAMLLTPEQTFFLRENLKLRLLNARLALLSRQFETAQSDLRDVQTSLDRYFDPHARQVTETKELLRQVQGQARQVVLPRPDDSLAALAAAASGR